MKLLAVSLYALTLTINCFAKTKGNGLCRGIDETIVLKDKKTNKLKGVLICSKQVTSRAVVIFKDRNDDGILDKNDTAAYLISKRFQVFRDILANKIDGFDEELKRHFEYSGKELTYYQIYIEDLIEVSNLKNIHKSILNPGGPEENSEEVLEGVSFNDLSVEDLYRQRYYNPKTGRFLSPEPTGIDGPNLYWYARNNPVNNVDPNGRQSISPISLVYFLGCVLTATAIVDRGIKEIRKSACETPQKTYDEEKSCKEKVKSPVEELFTNNKNESPLDEFLKNPTN